MGVYEGKRKRGLSSPPFTSSCVCARVRVRVLVHVRARALLLTLETRALPDAGKYVKLTHMKCLPEQSQFPAHTRWRWWEQARSMPSCPSPPTAQMMAPEFPVNAQNVSNTLACAHARRKSSHTCTAGPAQGQWCNTHRAFDGHDPMTQATPAMPSHRYTPFSRPQTSTISICWHLDFGCAPQTFLRSTKAPAFKVCPRHLRATGRTHLTAEGLFRHLLIFNVHPKLVLVERHQYLKPVADPPHFFTAMRHHPSHTRVLHRPIPPFQRKESASCTALQSQCALYASRRVARSFCSSCHCAAD